MKKIISILLLIIFVSANFSFADCSSCRQNALISNPTLTTAQVDSLCANDCTTQPITPMTTIPAGQIPTNNTTPTTLQQTSTPNTNQATSQQASANTQPVKWITINEDCLTNGQCKFNLYDTLGIRQNVRNEWDPTSVGLFVQDIVLSATFFIGTVVTIAIIVSWVMYIFAAATGKDPTNAKKWLTWALIGLVIVTCSYFIIRLVQYLAKWV